MDSTQAAKVDEIIIHAINRFEDYSEAAADVSFFLHNFLKIFGGHKSFFVGLLIPLFWIFGDVCLGFLNQSGYLVCVLCRMHVMESSNLPIVPYQLTS